MTRNTATNTTFNVTLSMSPSIPASDELTHSVMDGLIETYVAGLQEYLATLGIEADLKVTAQRVDYECDETA